jgi:hypothetical protein
MSILLLTAILFVYHNCGGGEEGAGSGGEVAQTSITSSYTSLIGSDNVKIYWQMFNYNNSYVLHIYKFKKNGEILFVDVIFPGAVLTKGFYHKKIGTYARTGDKYQIKYNYESCNNIQEQDLFTASNLTEGAILFGVKDAPSKYYDAGFKGLSDTIIKSISTFEEDKICDYKGPVSFKEMYLKYGSSFDASAKSAGMANLDLILSVVSPADPNINLDNRLVKGFSNLYFLDKIKTDNKCLRREDVKIYTKDIGNINGDLISIAGGNKYASGRINGPIEQLYVGVSAKKDVLIVERIMDNGTPLGFNLTVSYCAEFPYYDKSRSISDTTFKAPSAINLNIDPDCSFGIIESADNTSFLAYAFSFTPTASFPTGYIPQGDLPPRSFFKYCN